VSIHGAPVTVIACHWCTAYDGQSYFVSIKDGWNISDVFHILDVLRQLARPIDLSEDHATWDISSTGYYVDRIFSIVIGATVVAGTVLWGYGEYLLNGVLPCP